MSDPTPPPEKEPRPEQGGPAPETNPGADTPDDLEPSAALFDELDDLLQRMLSLPVNAPEVPLPDDVPLITIAEVMVEPPSSYSAPPPPFSFSGDFEAPIGGPPPPPYPEGDADRLGLEALAGFLPRTPPPAAPLSPSPEAGEGERGTGSGPSFKPLRKEEPQPTSAPVAGRPAPTADPVPGPEPAPPPWLRFLLWSNRTFDRCLLPLGAPAVWARRPAVRDALGWAGLALLATAGGLALHDWFGWTW